jgi:hypothetical protein
MITIFDKLWHRLCGSESLQTLVYKVASIPDHTHHSGRAYVNHCACAFSEDVQQNSKEEE